MTVTQSDLEAIELQRQFEARVKTLIEDTSVMDAMNQFGEASKELGDDLSGFGNSINSNRLQMTVLVISISFFVICLAAVMIAAAGG